MRDIDHKISRAIVNEAMRRGVKVLALEDLDGIRENCAQSTRKSRKNVGKPKKSVTSATEESIKGEGFGGRSVELVRGKRPCERPELVGHLHFEEKETEVDEETGRSEKKAKPHDKLVEFLAALQIHFVQGGTRGHRGCVRRSAFTPRRRALSVERNIRRKRENTSVPAGSEDIGTSLER